MRSGKDGCEAREMGRGNFKQAQSALDASTRSRHTHRDSQRLSSFVLSFWFHQKDYANDAFLRLGPFR